MNQQIQDIRQAIRDKLNPGDTYVGCIRVSLPIYVLHLKYSAKDNDPLFALDCAIIRMIDEVEGSGRKLDINIIASLLGFEYSVLQKRIRQLLDNHFISISQNTNMLKVTERGRSIYIDGTSRPTKMFDKDLPVDGRKLSLLPKKFYALRFSYINTVVNSICPFRATTAVEIKQDVLPRIERLSSKRKVEIGLPEDASDFELDGFSSVMQQDFYIAIFSKSGQMRRQLFFCGEELELAQFNDLVKIERFAIGGHTDKDGVTLYDIVDGRIIDESDGILSNSRDVFQYLNIIFGESNTFSVKNTSIAKDNDANRLPVIVSISYDMFRGMKQKRRVLQALKDKYLSCSVKGGGEFLIGFTTGQDKKMERLLEIDQQLDSEIGSFPKMTANDIYKSLLPVSASWRSDLIELQRFDLLEAIDINTYMKGGNK